MAAEYNGAVHYQDRQAYGDEMHRLARLRRAGWEVFVVVLEDLARHGRRTALTTSLKRALETRQEQL
ncbi:hypothetical protein GWK18_08400 [Kocuria sp. JC486]|uniref:Uncharacterized protein n=1 Tax=Kocuria soli TaxID=2485125 RepID=A0A3N3ZP81_9MICC|nr:MULTISPECIES: hypothetical protein [Kocuria]NHU85607.1 hypothetical protein [Kocuria sp. JC486]ROZ62783.1 hypothetical protein EDL96_08350 [Kocuria soli]